MSLPSSVVSTLLVLVVDVIALWFLDRALRGVAAYLNAAEVYDERKSIKTSDVWFERVSGRSHGPVWFRKTQVAVKAGMLICSIAVGLSIDGVTRKQKVRLLNQTVLVPRLRRTAQLGIGGLNNFSNDVVFVSFAQQCKSADGNDSFGMQTTYWNARSLETFDANGYGKDLDMECLSEKNGFSTKLAQIRVERLASV